MFCSFVLVPSDPRRVIVHKLAILVDGRPDMEIELAGKLQPLIRRVFLRHKLRCGQWWIIGLPANGGWWPSAAPLCSKLFASEKHCDCDFFSCLLSVIKFMRYWQQHWVAFFYFKNNVLFITLNCWLERKLETINNFSWKYFIFIKLLLITYYL